MLRNIDLQTAQHLPRELLEGLQRGWLGVRWRGVYRLQKNFLLAVIGERAADPGGQFVGDVRPLLYQLRTLVDQQVRSPAHARGNVAWDSEHFPALVGRQAGGDGGAAILRALDNKDAFR